MDAKWTLMVIVISMHYALCICIDKYVWILSKMLLVALIVSLFTYLLLLQDIASENR